MTEKSTAQDRRDSMANIVASWALEGMSPTAEDLADIEAYVMGTMTLQEIRDKTMVLYGVR